MTVRSCVVWGELLWDLFDDGPRLGGCACNVAYHLAVLGQPVQLVSRVGRDELGERALRELQRVGVDTDLVQVDAEQPTGSVHVDLRGPEPRYSIAQRVAWDRIELTSAGERALERAGAFVFGTLAQRTPLAHGTMQRALSLLPADCDKLCDLNLRRPFSLEAVIEASARAADVIKLNDQEATLVAEVFGVRNPARWLIEECDVQVVIETRGALGSVTTTAREQLVHPAAQVEGGGDTVGAGDAFCARVTAGLMNGESLECLLHAANRYAARVASLPGATPPKELLRGVATADP